MSSIIYNGHEIQDLIINGNQAQLWLNGQKIYPSGGTPVDPYNPLGLPPYTIRVKFKSGYTPYMGDTQTLVDADENVWDITKNSTDWSRLLYLNDHDEVIEVLGANSSGVTNMEGMFYNSSSLISVPLFDTTSVTNMSAMFEGVVRVATYPLFDTKNVTNFYAAFRDNRALTTIPLFDTSSCTDMSLMFMSCISLTSVPLFDTSSCTNMRYMFGETRKVESGALALYQQASTQANPPANHYDTFNNCGIDTVTGAAELAQIPTDWGGTYDPI